MPDLKPEAPTEGSSVTLVLGASNYSEAEQKNSALNYSSTSWTLGAVVEAADLEPHGAPARPLNSGGVQALDSVLQARVPEGKILRDTSGEF